MAGAVAISVVVPVKDEAGNVGPLAREIAAALNDALVHFKGLVVTTFPEDKLTTVK